MSATNDKVKTATMRQNPGNQYKTLWTLYKGSTMETTTGSNVGSTSTAVCLLLQGSIKFIKVKLSISILISAITGLNPSKHRQKKTSGLINQSEQSSRTSSCILPIFALDLRTAVKILMQMQFIVSPFFQCDARASLVDVSKTRDVSIASCVGDSNAALFIVENCIKRFLSAIRLS